jgi:hypothetical protein
MVERIRSPIVNGRGLAVEFLRLEDRVGHAIQVVDGDSARRVLTSVEGAAADVWPASPPLQNLHVEDRRVDTGEPSAVRRQVALAVGMAGRSHWSLSVEPDPRAMAIEFDVACRVPGDSGDDRLGSTYRAEWGDIRVAGDCCQLSLGDGWTVVLRALVEPASRLEVDSSEVVRVVPVASGLTTLRWKYRIELLADGR